MDYLPIFINLKQRRCLVVGGGEVAARKVALLLQAGAQVVVVAPELSHSLKEWHAAGQVEWSERTAAVEDLDGDYAWSMPQPTTRRRTG